MLRIYTPFVVYMSNQLALSPSFWLNKFPKQRFVMAWPDKAVLFTLQKYSLFVERTNIRCFLKRIFEQFDEK